MEELAYMIMEVKKSQDRCLQSGDPEMLEVKFSPKTQNQGS
jgi:hypothetical protein